MGLRAKNGDILLAIIKTNLCIVKLISNKYTDVYIFLVKENKSRELISAKNK